MATKFKNGIDVTKSTTTTAAAVGDVPLIVKAASGQTASLQKWDPANNTATVTSATSTSSTLTYTATNSFSAGQLVTVTGMSPSGYNLTNAVIATASGSQFTISSVANPGASTQGGTASTSVAAIDKNGIVTFAGGSFTDVNSGASTDMASITPVGKYHYFVNGSGYARRMIGYGSASNTIEIGHSGSSAFNGIRLNPGSAPSASSGYQLFQTGTATEGPTFTNQTMGTWSVTGGSIGTQWTLVTTDTYTHATGNTNVLTNSFSVSSARGYRIVYTVTGRTAGTFDLAIGGQSLTGQSATGTWEPVTSSTAAFTVTPTSTFNGTIAFTITYQSAFATPVHSIYDSGGTVTYETRMGGLAASANLGIGKNVLRRSTTGTSNTAFGSESLRNTTTGSNNTAVGYLALQSNHSGNSLVAIGSSAYGAIVSGTGGIAIGHGALQNATTGSNIAIGYYALGGNTAAVSASTCLAIGQQSGYNITSGGSNILVGTFTGYTITTGGSNVAVGYNAGRGNANQLTYLQTKNYNTFIGFNAGYNTSQADVQNSTAIGANTYTTADNQVVIGDSAITDTKVQNLTSTAQSASGKAIVAKAAASQTANIQEWRDSSENVLSAIGLGGAIQLPYRAITGARTLDASDYTIDCTSGTFTVTLPAASTTAAAAGVTGRIFNIKNSGTGTITIARTGTDTIDGQTSITMNGSIKQYQSITVQSTGTGWIII